MNGSPARPRSLFRIAGIGITIDPSWLIIAGLMTFALTHHFRLVLPGFAGASYWTAGIVGALVFFGSVLVHELSHSAVARLLGIEVQGITLFIFGGVSRLKGEAKRPRDEFIIAAVGPLASLALAVLFMAGSLLLPPASLPGVTVAWLAFANFALAVFNLVPGYPLDGGRVFRAAAWAATGDLAKATRIAAFFGSAVAVALMAGGAVLALGFGLLLNGLWLAFIGWFLFSASRAGAAQVQLKGVLERLHVSQAMRRFGSRISPSETVDFVVRERVLRNGERALYVTDDAGSLLGLVTTGEIKNLPRDRWPSTLVSSIMIPVARLRYTSPAQTVLEAVQTMDDSGQSQLPVLEDGLLLGIVTREDLLHLVSVNVELGGDERPGRYRRSA